MKSSEQNIPGNSFIKVLIRLTVEVSLYVRPRTNMSRTRIPTPDDTHHFSIIFITRIIINIKTYHLSASTFCPNMARGVPGCLVAENNCFP